MKALIIMLVLVSVSFAFELIMFSSDSSLTSETVHNYNWIRIYETEILHVDSVVVFSDDSLSLCNAYIGMDDHREVPDSTWHPSNVVLDTATGAYRGVVSVDFDVLGYGYMYVQMLGSKIRATNPVWYRTYRSVSDPLEYDANVIFYGTPGVSLDRSTWASIKTSF